MPIIFEEADESGSGSSEHDNCGDYPINMMLCCSRMTLGSDSENEEIDNGYEPGPKAQATIPGTARTLIPKTQVTE